ncbi:MAG TPA: hypothetical protein DD381_10610 [Lentisphaeria bacterium]|nr:MAG: hypothetical protein A2X47_02060 [Lentisphaerae bacterium GWF2_38_69]HBM16778.1 hypothetical protein [Lentisphaeria bacterium]
MIKKILTILLFTLSLSLTANQGINTNPNPDIQQSPSAPGGAQVQNHPSDNNFQPPENPPQDAFQQFGTDEGTESAKIKTPDPSSPIFDIKTTHGSIIIKKLPAKPETDTGKNSDTAKSNPSITNPDTQKTK